MFGVLALDPTSTTITRKCSRVSCPDIHADDAKRQRAEISSTPRASRPSRQRCCPRGTCCSTASTVPWSTLPVRWAVKQERSRAGRRANHPLNPAVHFLIHSGCPPLLVALPLSILRARLLIPPWVPFHYLSSFPSRTHPALLQHFDFLPCLSANTV